MKNNKKTMLDQPPATKPHSWDSMIVTSKALFERPASDVTRGFDKKGATERRLPPIDPKDFQA